MTKQGFKNFCNRYSQFSQILKGVLTVYEASTNEQICSTSNIQSIMESLGLEMGEKFRQLVEDVSSGRNTKYKILFNSVDVCDSSPNDGCGMDGFYEWYDEFVELVKEELIGVIEYELHDLEDESGYRSSGYYARVPEGFSDMNDFESYCISLREWVKRSNIHPDYFEPPPLRDDVPKVKKSNTTKQHENPCVVVAQTGCGLVGLAWFAFLGISFVACILMWVGGCLKGCSMSGAYSEEQLERIIH